MTTPPISSITDDLIAELDLCMRADCGIELESADIRALLAERADLKQQLVAAGITADNCEMFRKDAERYLAALSSAKYRIEQGRVWNGVGWTLTGMHPLNQQKAIDEIDAAMRQ